MALVSAVVVGSTGFYAMRLEDRAVTRALRVALWCVIGGLAMYVIYVLSLSYLGFLDGRGEVWTAGVAALVGSAFTLLLAWIIAQRRWSERA